MKNFLIVFAIIGVILGGIVFSVWQTSVQYQNADVSKLSQIVGEQKACEAEFDNCWKQISQTYQVAQQYSQDFKDLYMGIANARYSGKNPMLSLITEANPSLSPDLYKNVQAIITDSRNRFTSEQKKLIDMAQQYDSWRGQYFCKLYLGAPGPTQMSKIKIVTSTKTDAAFSTGKDDDIDLNKH